MRCTTENKISGGSIYKLDAFCISISLKDKNLNKQVGLLSHADQKAVKELIVGKRIKAGKPFLMKSQTKKTFFVIFVESEWTEKKMVLAVRQFIRLSKAEGFKHVGIETNAYSGDKARNITLISENAELAHFDFAEEFKTKPKDGWRRIVRMSIFTSLMNKQAREALRVGELTAKWVNRSRILCNYPPSHLKPEGFAEAARTIVNEVETLSVEVFDERRLKAEGMNAILAVGQGSEAKPRLVMVEYKAPLVHSLAGGPLVLVGKGITFDSGGLNTKGNHMEDMHMDMAGAAGVLCAIALIAELKLPIHVIGIMPMAENMPSGISYRQGDIITAYGGKTIEIGNTDAEGRVVMADAIEYAKTKKPQLIVSLATLTGAVMHALGLRLAGLFVKENKELAHALEQVGDYSGDEVWQLPLSVEDEKDIEGNVADVINTSKTNTRYGWATLGAAFLSYFAKPVPFVHIDMGSRMKNLKEEHLASGATGYGVRYFAEVARQWEDIRKVIK